MIIQITFRIYESITYCANFNTAYVLVYFNISAFDQYLHCCKSKRHWKTQAVNDECPTSNGSSMCEGVSVPPAGKCIVARHTITKDRTQGWDSSTSARGLDSSEQYGVILPRQLNIALVCYLERSTGSNINLATCVIKLHTGAFVPSQPRQPASS